MIPGDPSTLRDQAAKALVSVAEKGDEAVKAALIERLKADECGSVRWRLAAAPLSKKKAKGKSPSYRKVSALPISDTAKQNKG
eukprot:3350564-Amphidinium_carterae.1